MDDLISRQDAIDALMNNVPVYGIVDDDGNIESGCKDKDVIAMLYKLPSAQPENTILKAINNIRALTGCEELIITDKDSMRTWDANGVEYKLYPERKKGEWLKAGVWHGNQIWTCSECEIDEVVPTATNFSTGIAYPQWSFCPNCGAEMRGEEDDTD